MSICYVANNSSSGFTFASKNNKQWADDFSVHKNKKGE